MMRNTITVFYLLTFHVLSLLATDNKMEFSAFGGDLPKHPTHVAISNIPPEYQARLFERTKKKYLKEAEKLFKCLNDVGIVRSYFHYNNNPVFNYNNGELVREVTKLGYKYNISVSPILNGGRVGKLDWKKFGVSDAHSLKAVEINTGKEYPYVACCPNNPEGRKAIIDYVSRVTSYLKDCPGFNVIALDDEYTIVSPVTNGMVGCVCKSCKALFKTKTGMAAPISFTAPPTGSIVSTKSPLFKWLQIIGAPVPIYGGPSFRRYNETMRKAVKSVKPDIEVCQVPGIDGLDRNSAELYSVDGFAGDYMINYIKAFQYPENKPLAMIIGCFSPSYMKNETIKQAAQRARINGLACIANQVKEIGIHPNECLSRYPEIKREAAQLGKIIAQHGKTILSLEPEKKPIAVLWSRITASYQSLPPASYNQAQKHNILQKKAWINFRKKHIPVELITERHIQNGSLNSYRALIILNLEYTTTDILTKINSFASYYPVFYDKTTTVKIHGIPIDTKHPEKIYNNLKDTLPKIKLDSDQVFHQLLKKGNTRYLFILNPNSKEVSTTISVLYKVKNVSELFTRKKIKTKYRDGTLSFNAVVEPNNWKVFLLK